MPQLRFLLEAFDLQQCCPVLQAQLLVDDPEALCAILGEMANGDAELEGSYPLDDRQLAAITATFNVTFDVEHLDGRDLNIGMYRWHSNFQMPYLAHGGYELPLLLDGRKKLARISSEYPPMKFVGEERFDHWVAQSVLHREEVDERFDPPMTSRGRTLLGHRTVYYTPKGEEWRIPAMKLVFEASSKSGGWNEYFERLEGMLFGYEDWQNDWWINVGMTGGGFGGVSICCAVTAAGLTWIETAGFRALPPIDRPTVTMRSYDQDTETELIAAMFADPDSTAVVCFNMPGHDVMSFLDLRHRGPWDVKAERIAELNRLLRGSVVVIARRDRAVENVE
jgi:hypothetical protein